MTHYLTNYAHFTNKFDLDNAVTLHKQAHWGDLNATDRIILDVIRQYSVKFGAAHLKHATIQEITGKSNSTVRRCLRKLCQLDIIERFHYVRPVMNGLGANIYAVKPFVDKQKPNKKNPVEKKTVDKQSAPAQNSQTNLVEETPQSTSLFNRMKTMLASTIGSAETARKFFGVYRQLTKPILKFSIHEHKTALFEQLSIQALQIAIQATKRKDIQNLPGYYAGVLRELIDKALFGDLFMEYDEPVDYFVPVK